MDLILIQKNSSQAWYEDRNAQNNRYGHRDGGFSVCGKTPRNFIYDYFDQDPNGGPLTAVNCATGCVHWGQDAPGGPTEAVRKLKGHLQFKLVVIDTCNGDKEVATSDIIMLSFDHQEESEDGKK